MWGIGSQARDRQALFVATALLVGLLSQPALSASLPSAGAVQNSAREVEAFYESLDRTASQSHSALSLDELIDETSEAHVSAHASAPAGEASIWISRIDVPASEIIDAEVLEALTGAYEQREVTLSELNLLVAEINDQYRQRQYITARAYLPQQTVQDGVVAIRLIEARIDDVEITENRFTRDGYIKRRLRLEPGELADVRSLEETLNQFNAAHDVELRALLQPGEQPNTTRYVVQALEPKNHTFSVFADNAGRKTIGKERIGLRYINSSVMGRRDRLSVGGSYAEGAFTGFASYSLPVSKHGTRAIFSADYSEIVIVSGALETFNIRGDSMLLSAFLSQPLWLTPRTSLYGLVGVNAKESSTDFDDVDRFESSLRSASIAADYQMFGDGFMFYVRPQLNAGVDRTFDDRSFTTLNGDAGFIANPGSNHRVALRLSGQVADVDGLPSAEQFQLGGTASVRGYPEGFFIGDQGYYVSAEYRYLGLYQRFGRHTLEPFFFADHGGVFDSRREQAADRSEYLASMGFGFTHRFSHRISTTLQFGFPMSARSGFDDDYFVHFYINFMPF